MLTRAMPARITRPAPALPILIALGATEIAIRAGSVFHDGETDHSFHDAVQVTLPDPVPGRDYGIRLTAQGEPVAVAVDGDPIAAGCFAGFHFAPGGNAEARAGGSTTPGINPCSFWDLDFRPACDPRGMTLVEAGGRRFWSDIYLLGTGHEAEGTSRHGVEIADGASLDCLDFKTASAILANHGKRFLTYDEFRTAAHGVTERSAASKDPRRTGLDAGRTSRFGLMQATGNLWIWGTDGDPDDARPSIFGGSWFLGSIAGSRYARLDYWPENSSGSLSARGACDHLSPE